MRNFLFGLGAVGILSGMVACGGDDTPPVIDGDKGGNGATGGRGSAGSKSGGTDANDAGAGGMDAAGGPAVVITAPAAVSDPNDPGVLGGTEVTVTCIANALAGGAAVNESSAELSLLDADGVVLEKKPGARTARADEFTAAFELTSVPAGKLGFACSVTDEAMATGRDEIYSLLDKGPSIEFVTPVADSAHPLTTPLDIAFSVVAAPLSDDDDAAEVDSVSLEVGGKGISLEGKSDGDGNYQVQVNLADPRLFTPSPSGALPLVVRASNKRMPNAVEAVRSEQVDIDGDGPDITITSPEDGKVVGGKVTLTFGVKDAIAGVDPATVAVSLNATEYKFSATDTAWTRTGDTFSLEFDSRQFKDAKVQITVNVSAKDRVGNISESGPTASSLLYLDNFAPLIDLDPFNIRTVDLQGQCSTSFDPVGTLAKNDLTQAARAGVFRALVWEQTNTDPEIPFRHYAFTDQNTVRLYLAAAGTPLLVDKDGIAGCDDVAEVDSNSSFGLDVVPKAGTFLFEVGEEGAYPATADLNCSTMARSAPDRLCTAKASDMWQVIEHPVIKEAAIYAPTVMANTVECTGQSWEFGPKLNQDGWVCFAARVVDKVGNVGVSRPLRVCVDDPDRVGTPACANSSVDAPSCTDGCTPAPRVALGKVLFE
jgi:hypothetical protein